MEVILLEKVENLGKLGDKVRVKSGFARNFLIPKGKAKFATPENIAAFEARRAELEKAAEERVADARTRADKLAGMTIRIASKAGTEGKLFGSVGAQDIAHAISAAGVAVDKREIRLPASTPLRQVGEFEIDLHLHADVKTTVKVEVTAEM